MNRMVDVFDWGREWIKALRSDDYVQGTGCLRKENFFCCLGVLADLQGIDFSRPTISSFFTIAQMSGAENASALSTLGMTHLALIPQDIRDFLGYANDGGSSFTEIADWIEDHLLVDDSGNIVEAIDSRPLLLHEG